MSDSNHGLVPSASNSLKAMALAEKLEFYREAEATNHPDIRDHILREIERDAEHHRRQEELASAHRRKQEARLSPSVALGVCIVAFVAAAGAIIYMHVDLKISLVSEACGIPIFSALAISAVALLLSNALKPAEFLEMLRHAGGYLGFGKQTSQTTKNSDVE